MDELTPKREYVSLKLLPAVIEQIDALAARENRSRSNMIEVLLQEALALRAAAEQSPFQYSEEFKKAQEKKPKK